jgi:hypothetical protein
MQGMLPRPLLGKWRIMAIVFEEAYLEAVDQFSLGLLP